MKIESLELLEKADVPPTQARAILRAIELATAHDSADTKNEVALLRQEILGWRRELATSSATPPTCADKSALQIDLQGTVHSVARDQARYVYIMFAIQTVILMILMLALFDIARHSSIT